MRDLKQLASNKIEAKIYAMTFERQKLNGELAMGLSAGVTIKEGYSVLERLNDDLEVYEFILKSINK